MTDFRSKLKLKKKKIQIVNHWTSSTISVDFNRLQWIQIDFNGFSMNFNRYKLQIFDSQASVHVFKDK